MKLLFGVQGTGNGHISRAHAMAPELAKVGIEVDFLFSGREPSQYFDMQRFGEYQTRRGFTFATEQGRINWLKTLKCLNLSELRRDINELDLSGYDAVLNDYEPITAHAAKRQKIPVIGISHQNAFRYRVPKVPFRSVNFAIMNRLAPVDTAIGLHWDSFGESILPPIVDPVHQCHSSHSEPTVLVYLPFENLAELSHLLAKITDQQFIVYHPECVAQTTHNCEFKPLSRDGFAADLARCESVFCNAGFELPSEALSMGKRLLVKPVKGQIEQLSNAMALEQLRLGWSTRRLDRELISDWLETTPSPARSYPNVARALAEWLAAGRRESLSRLSARLWEQSRSISRSASSDHSLSSLALASVD